MNKTNEIRRALIVELSRVAEWEGVALAFERVAERYKENAEEVKRIFAAVMRYVWRNKKND